MDHSFSCTVVRIYSTGSIYYWHTFAAVYFAWTLSPITTISNLTVTMSSNDASSELSRSAEIESEYSLIFLAAIYSLMLISKLCTLFEEHLKLPSPKRHLRRTWQKISLVAQKHFPFSLLKNALDAFKGFLNHKNKEMVSKAFGCINQGHFDALVSDFSCGHWFVNLFTSCSWLRFLQLNISIWQGWK